LNRCDGGYRDLVDTFAWLALGWLLLYLCVRYLGRWLTGGQTEPASSSYSEDDESPVLVARPRIGSAPAAIATMSRGALAALIARRTQSKLRVRAASRANGTSRRVLGGPRLGGSASPLPRR
jgi:hypothetical protein